MQNHPTSDPAPQAEPAYIVGHSYRVPAIRVVKRGPHNGWHYGFAGWLPVMGPEHEDAELINFPQRHYHVDWRFVEKRVFDFFKAQRPYFAGFAFPLCMRKDSPKEKDPQALQDIIATPRPMLVRLKCKREWPAFPWSQAPWLPDLQALYADQDAAVVCPHRGIPASCYIREADGWRCPGHGLLISEAGKVVTSG